MKLKQLEPVVETIGDYKFYITPFPALKAANMTGELASLMLPLFGALAPLVKDGDGEKKGNSDKKKKRPYGYRCRGSRSCHCVQCGHRWQ